MRTDIMTLIYIIFVLILFILIQIIKDYNLKFILTIVIFLISVGITGLYLYELKKVKKVNK